MHELLVTFEKYEICQIPRFLAAPSADQQVKVLAIDVPQGSWMNPIPAYLQNGELPEDKLEAHHLRARSARYYLYNDKLYKRRFSIPFLRCIDGVDCQAMLEEIHAGQCGNYTGALSLVQKALR